ncbi:MAG TPA: PAS domain S-box protein [Stellaceae bacterium]|nr:PAS domain S-box protein [Stellaceae bacterium]
MASKTEPSQGLLAGVLETIGDAVYAMDRGERILYANRRAFELWGKHPDEVVGYTLREAFPGVEAGEPYRAYRSALTTREPVHIETVAPALGGRWIALDVHPAAEGGLVVVFRDIDQRKRTEEALRESAERFRSMLEALPLMAYVFDTNGDALYYNRQFYHYVGPSVGRSAAARSAVLHADDRAMVDEARSQGFVSGQEYAVEVRIRRHDGAYLWHRIHNRPMPVDDTLMLWLGTAVDIHEMHAANELLEDRVAERTAELEAANRRLAAQIEEREEAEAQLRQAQRIEAVGQLTAGIAHDFNNLLTSIIGNVELLASRLGAVDERSRRLLAAALSAAERGAALTAQLLAFSRQQRMNPEAIDLNQVVAGMASLLQSTIGASIRIDLAPAKRLWLALADIAQIELVLLNLTINARDAMPAGGSIRIETGNAKLGPPRRPEEPPAGEYVMVSVVDTGAGIATDILEKVFDPFFTTKEIGKGSGLGLSQVLGVAQQLGGGVRIETQPGEGTAVRVFLPRVHAVPVDTVRSEATRAGTVADSIRQLRTILLVDDDSDVRAVAAAMLLNYGLTVIEAGSGGAALERLDQDKPPIDMLIADIAMPGMSGLELGRAARQSRPDLPILFITGFSNTVGFENAVSTTVLQKPFRVEELAAKIAEALGKNAERVGLKLPPTATPSIPAHPSDGR